MIAAIDTHAHICDGRFDPDRAAVLDRARAAGVSAIVAVGETVADCHRNLELAAAFPILRPAAGLYPEFADLASAERLAGLVRLHRQRLVAVGEIGLDYWLAREEADRGLQREVLALFIDLAAELGLPLNVHSRSAGRQTVELLLRKDAGRVQLHAFDGKLAAALPAVEAGYFFSVPPSVVRSRQKQKLVAGLPLSCLLVETDSPVLGPEPGVRNEPANLGAALAAVAAIKHIAVEELAGIVYANTMRLYGQNLLSLS
ncbi:MAG: TatD family hydrolase [Thermodesulfobacteriota bacterium]